jgi:Mrp family chromosome partitioning ATPase
VGEIADALRRAHAERVKLEEAGISDPAGTRREPVEDIYSESAKRHEQELSAPQGERPAREAPTTPAPPAPAERAAQPPISRPQDEELPGVQLTHDAEEARVPQGVLIDEGGAVTDACLQLALRVRKALFDMDARTIVVASAMRNEGKTTVSCNLALSLASLGQSARVALVDLDLRRPSLGRVLELPVPACGIEDVIAAGRPLEHARVRIVSPRLDVYPCLRGQLKAHELLLTPSFATTLCELRERYEIVVLDTPPALIVPDATIIMEHADCYAMVARAGMTRARNLKRMLETLPPKRMLGSVLDGGATHVRKIYYERYTPDAREEDDG